MPSFEIYMIQTSIFLYASGKEKDNTEENIPKPFYGPPSNCVDLAKLDYT